MKTASPINIITSISSSTDHALATSVIDDPASPTGHIRSDVLSRESAKARAPISGEKLFEEGNPANEASNSTLGFEKIIAINLPERSDRRDALTLMSVIQQIDLDWQDAVKGTDVTAKAWPAHWNTGENKHMKSGDLGSWRSHINTLRRIVEERYSTTLIIEDDADWDISLKSQLRTFADKTRLLGNIALDQRTHSPYGDDWDILWLGNCATPPGPPESQTFPGVGNQMHWVFHAKGGMSCVYGYAITQWAAKMLMGWLLDLDQPLDFAVSAFCEHHKCITVWPELIGSHKSAGPPSRDSNIGNYSGEFREKGTTRNIVNSAILDMLSRMGH